MSFLYPAFLAGAVAIAIPIVLHFLRRDVAPEVPFSAVRLLRRSPIERSRRRRLRDLLLLAARVAALILLALAFARPYRAGAAVSSSLRIVAIDRSLSMSAPGAFARALSIASHAMDDAAPGERVAVIAFDDRADVVSEPGRPASARAALTSIKPGDGATRYASMLGKAAEVAGADPARLVVVTDLQRSGWDGNVHVPVPANLTVDVKDSGAPAANVSVTGIRVEPDRVFATIRNAGSAPWSGDVRVERDGHVVATAAAMVPAVSTGDATIGYHSPVGGSLSVSIDDAAGFAPDNRRFVVLEPATRSSVILVNAGDADSGFYAGRALGVALDDADVRVIAASKLTPEDLRGHDAVVLLSTRGMDRRAREGVAAFVRAGGGLFVAGSTEVEPIVLSTAFGWKPALAATERPAATIALSATDIRHPILRPFGALAANLGQVRFDRAWRIGEGGWLTVARFTDGSPALLERREGRGRIALFASDLDRRWNDFPLSPAYVPFMAETVRYVRAPRDSRREYVVGSAPEGAGPDAGVYRIPADNRLVAVNVDPKEGAIAVMSPAEFASMIDPVQPADGGTRDARARQIEARQNYWEYGLILMLAALVAESLVGRA